MISTRDIKQSTQYLISIALVLLISSICFSTAHLIGYRVVALVLLMTVSIIAMLFEIWPVLFSAFLSAIIWNFFFIPPLFTFHIDHAEDVLMFLLYFLIACVNAVLTSKIRKEENRIREQEEKEKTINLYNTLLNSLSHELRTPISTILGAVDALMDHKDKLSAENQTTLLSEIDKASIRLNRQVENLLNMSRLESGMLKPKIDWCDLDELIQTLIHKFDIDPSHPIIYKSPESLPLYKTDGGLIEHVLMNLIQNAIQYTTPNTPISIETMPLENAFAIIVNDKGPGFPLNVIDLVFNKFYRLPQTKTGGSGLGLSIVKGFVEALHGKVKLENNPDKGAKFTIIIPAETNYMNSLNNE